MKREIEEEEEGMCVNMRSAGIGSGGKEVVEVRQTEVSIGAKVFFCGHEVGEKDMSAIADEIWVTSGGREEKGKRKTEEVVEIAFQWRVELDQSMAWIVSW